MSSRWIRLTTIVAEREIRQRGRSRAFLVSTIVLLLGILTVIGTFLSDLLLMWIDPRIRLEGR